MFSSYIINQKQTIALNWTQKKNLIHWWNQQSHLYTENEIDFDFYFQDTNQKVWDRRKIIYELLDKNDAKVLDIGSGIATHDLFVSKIYPEYQFYLLDKSQSQIPASTIFSIKKNIAYNEVFQNRFFYYNNWDPTLDAIKNSGIDINRFNFVNPDNKLTEKVDIILSMASWLWHYYDKSYENYVDNLLNPGGFLAIDYRNHPHNIKLHEFVEKYSLSLIDEIPIVLNEKDLGSTMIYRKNK